MDPAQGIACEIDDYLPLSGIQHYAYCPRQWALIHLEGLWAENARTAAGEVDHRRCHDEKIREKRGGLIAVRGFRVVSHRLALVGICDVLELTKSPDGVPIHGEAGLYQAAPVEYKHGRTKATDEDRVQLCAQAMAVEEMLACEVPIAHIFYAAQRRREDVEMGADLRRKTTELARAMHEAYRRGTTPPARRRKGCAACSLRNECLPEAADAGLASAYLRATIESESA